MAGGDGVALLSAHRLEQHIQRKKGEKATEERKEGEGEK